MPEHQAETVGVIGLGAMGFGIAQSLLRNGFDVYGYDVRSDIMQNFTAAGGHAATSPAEVGKHARIVLIVVLNAQQTDAVLFGADGFVSTAAPNSVVVTSATVAPEFAIQIGDRLQQYGLHNIDAPISGGAAKAASGELSVMASGTPAAFAVCEKVFSAIAANLYRLGDAPGAGSKVKMINQLLAGVHIAAAAEAIALGIHAGADPQVLYDVICNSAGSSWMFQNRVPHILAGDYTPLSQVDIFVKDLGIVLDAGHAGNFPLPLTAVAHQMYLMAAAAGHGKEDDSAVIKIFPGVKLPTPD